MLTTSNLTDAVWMLGAGTVYFRAVLTSDRNLQRFLQDGGQIVSTAILQETEKKGPIKIYDPRVLLSALLISLPACLGPLLSNGRVSEILMLIALGAFVSPLTLPTSPLALSDLKVPARYVLKWMFGLADRSLKLLVLLGLCYLLFKIPVLGRFLQLYAHNAFAVVKGSNSEIFEDSVATAMLLMFALRMTQLSVHGFAFSAFWTISTVYIWVSLQYEANEILHLVPLSHIAWVVFATSTLIDFINDTLEVIIESLD